MGIAGCFVQPVKCMKTLAYALAGCLLILAPFVAADPTGPSMPEDPSSRDPCSTFAYWLEPTPGFRVDPDCLLGGG